MSAIDKEKLESENREKFFQELQRESFRKSVEIAQLRRQLKETQAKLEEATRAAAAYEAMPVVGALLTDCDADIKHASAYFVEGDDYPVGEYTISIQELVAKPSTTSHLDALLQAARQDEREKAIPEVPTDEILQGMIHQDYQAIREAMLSAAPKE